MTMAVLAKAAKQVLIENQGAICAHIDSVLAVGRYTNIEKTFAVPFDSYIADRLKVTVDRKKTTDEIGSENFYARSTSVGKVDAVYVEHDGWTAAEYKAVRMPRRKGDARFDICQLGADGQRLRQAKGIKRGWVIVFLYGPMVEDAGSSGTLEFDFLGQMFLDCQNAIADELICEGDDGNFEFTKLMGWHNAPRDDDRPTSIGVKVGRLGAVIIECKGD